MKHTIKLQRFVGSDYDVAVEINGEFYRFATYSSLEDILKILESAKPSAPVDDEIPF